MIVVKKVLTLQQIIREHKADGKSIGFTPTMGALHDGHHTLIQRSMDDCDISICSIFVNPTQFNEATDLDNYPGLGLPAGYSFLEKAYGIGMLHTLQ